MRQSDSLLHALFLFICLLVESSPFVHALRTRLLQPLDSTRSHGVQPLPHHLHIQARDCSPYPRRLLKSQGRDSIQHLTMMRPGDSWALRRPSQAPSGFTTMTGCHIPRLKAGRQYSEKPEMYRGRATRVILIAISAVTGGGRWLGVRPSPARDISPGRHLPQ